MLALKGQGVDSGHYRAHTCSLHSFETDADNTADISQYSRHTSSHTQTHMLPSPPPTHAFRACEHLLHHVLTAVHFFLYQPHDFDFSVAHLADGWLVFLFIATH